MTSLKARMTLILLGFVSAVLAVTLLAVLLSTAANVREQASEELRVGARVFEELLSNRDRQLSSTTQVLADDFAFREAVATEDAATIRSALLNHGGRIDADLMILSDTKGQFITTALRENDNRFRELDPAIGQNDLRQGVISLEGEAWQMVDATVRAPLPLARVSMGFRLDDRIAADLRSLTGLHVSFLSSTDETAPYASTLPGHVRRELPERLAEQATAIDDVRTLTIAGEDYLSLRLTLDGHPGSPIVLLQTSLSEALAPYRPLWLQMAIIALIAFTLTLIIAGPLANRVTRPTRALAAAAARISQGDYSRSAPVPPIAELAQLGEAFNAMQEGIRQREQRILHQAYHDPLTGLPNRTLAADRLEQGIERVQREGRVLGVLVLDVNRFKEINDSLGHPTGDAVLRAIASRLSSRLRGSDTVARLGGDEFLVLAEVEDKQGPERLAAELIDAISGQELEIENIRLQLAISLGIALCPRDGTDVETLLRRADIAMYQAKERQLTSSVYAAGHDEAHLRRLKMLSDLRTAIDDEQFHIQYQPKIAVSNRQATQLEALIRWNHPEQGFVPPDEFIPLAENSGYIRTISRWVLQTVIRQLAEWRRSELSIAVAVNISALDLVDAGLPRYVQALLDQHELPPSALGLEITETTVMKDARHALHILQELRSLGVAIAIDDFGTGYSSLAQLRSLPVDELKIDKSFVMKLAGQAEDAEDPVIVRSTIDLAHNMGLKVVAEGVEDEATWWRLAGYGCDSIQGYWISRPMPADALPEWLGEFANRQWREPD
ncbi:putative bifunctional diguanylate cyclase/phosphodiesterase [Natronospira bacteriovora]|uniref:EAL domain-containing protein n=1 Tax=Natronospira bacteriovora TaxID=3069753 RepID=A0ABU0W6R0_9GAMM|nr:EAL domain-containing protein [Natronospira sp. AB-CW4]MDQ2069714.1 EAL domain-containing protein [Natronospira sp. AB-CW4]